MKVCSGERNTMVKRAKDLKDQMVEPEVIDLTSAPTSEPEPCLKAIAQSFPKLDPIARVGLYSQVLSMRESLHMRPKGRRGRPKGSGLKEHTTDAFELWKQGYAPSEICHKLGIPQQERTRIKSRIRSMKRRLPDDERQAAVRAHYSMKGGHKSLGVLPPRT